MKKPGWTIAIASGIAAIGAITAWAFLGTQEGRVPIDAAPAEDSSTSDKHGSSGVSVNEHVSREVEVYRHFNELEDSRDKVKFIEGLATETWVTTDLPLLERAMDPIEDETVQCAALETSLRIASARNPSAVPQVLKRGIASPTPATRRRALKLARNHPSSELVDQLLDWSRSQSEDSFLALDALAFSNDSRGKDRVLEVAQDESAEGAFRLRAVALLAKTKDERALPLLHELEGSDKPEVRRIAKEVLKAYKN